MGGPGIDYEQKDCPKGQRGKGRKTLKIAIDTRESCDKAKICIIPCKHKKNG